MKVVKCYYCGDYFDEEERGDWDICEKCEAEEEASYGWLEAEHEEYLLRNIDDYDLQNISIKLAYEEEEE